MIWGAWIRQLESSASTLCFTAQKKKIIQKSCKVKTSREERKKEKNWVQHIDMATLEWVLGHAKY